MEYPCEVRARLLLREAVAFDRTVVSASGDNVEITRPPLLTLGQKGDIKVSNLQSFTRLDASCRATWAE